MRNTASATNSTRTRTRTAPAHFRYPKTTRALAWAIGGYAAVGAIGWLIASSMGGEGMADLALASLTALLLAPLGALLGVVLAAKRQERRPLEQQQRLKLTSISLLVSSAVAATYWMANPFLSVAVAILGLTLIKLARVALAEWEDQRVTA